ncbi:hypothetical protein KBA63_04285 [Candidatus Woesebacteria bacterium]|nr:hypothetical protein [Candidatus Woesebacteria bacterium]MBP9687956.1 hypothetical protein [Candidatus Woesebacteria bacterium]
MKKKIVGIVSLCLVLASVVAPAAAGRRGNIEGKVVRPAISIPIRCGSDC